MTYGLTVILRKREGAELISFFHPMSFENIGLEIRGYNAENNIFTIKFMKNYDMDGVLKVCKGVFERGENEKY